jgi:hypothetical protein
MVLTLLKARGLKTYADVCCRMFTDGGMVFTFLKARGLKTFADVC